MSLVCGALVAGAAFSPSSPAHAAADTVDEVHYSFGETPDMVVFDWHGAETTLFYGPDATYGQQAVATPSAVSPVDSAGPFEEVKLTGLVPASTYHYRIGSQGLDHTFTTAPTGDFTWADIGDTATTLCNPWVSGTHDLIAAQSPNFVTQGGDISYANECGVGAVHQYYVDQQVWSLGAASQPVWGNHEYGPVRPQAPVGTPANDSLLNYKGRSYVTHGQTVPSDTSTRTTNPGCGWETISNVNTCPGEDWGWFTAGHVLYIAYPEPWVNAYTDWQQRAGDLMASAQADPTIDFVITYGHRPAYTSQSAVAQPLLRSALTALAQTYSPQDSNPAGKYILNVAHHVHGEEVFSPVNGLVNITNGGGGAGQVVYDAVTAVGSLYRGAHPGILVAHYSANNHSLSLKILCGPDYTPKVKEPCSYGSTLYDQTFLRPNSPPQRAVLSTSLSDGVSNPLAGQQFTYTAAVTNKQVNSTASDVTATLTLPPNLTVLNVNGGTLAGNTVTWSLGSLAGGQNAVALATVQLLDTPLNSPVTATVQATSSDNSCATAGSVCSASDTDVVAAPPAPVHEWVGNSGIEEGLTGWTGRYGSTTLIATSRDIGQSHTGAASISVTALSGAVNLYGGFSDSPRWVTSTTAGVTYWQSAWIKPSFVGQKVSLRLKEWQGKVLVASRVVTLTAASVNWQQLSQGLTAAASGNQLSLAVNGNAMSSGQFFNVDDLSLTSPT